MCPGVQDSKSTGYYTLSSAQRLVTLTTPLSVLPMLANHWRLTWAGMLAPFAIPMPVYDQQHTLLAYSVRWIFKQELQLALVDLGWVPS